MAGLAVRITIDNGSITNSIPNTTAMVFYDDLGPPNVRLVGAKPTDSRVRASPWIPGGSAQATDWLAPGGQPWVGPPRPPPDPNARGPQQQPPTGVRARIHLIVLRDANDTPTYWRPERNENAQEDTKVVIGLAAGTTNKVMRISQSGPGLVDVNLVQDTHIGGTI